MGREEVGQTEPVQSWQRSAWFRVTRMMGTRSEAERRRDGDGGGIALIPPR